MAEPLFRAAEVVVPPVVAANGTRLSLEGVESISERGGAPVALNHGSSR